MVFHGKCSVCGCASFNAEGGFYYCTECNTQNQNVVEMEVDAMDMTMGDATIRVQGVRLREDKQEAVELTSWEEYNYVLLGLVNECIALGAPLELKKTVLQLWTRYLQRINAAFFTKTDIGIPKLPSQYYQKDAQILYNVSKKRRKSKSSRSSKSTASKVRSLKKNRVLSMARAKARKALMREQMEIDSAKLSNEDETTMTTMSMATKSAQTAKTTIPLVFTGTARRVMKRRMPKKHIQKHAEDSEGVLNCHKKTTHTVIYPEERMETPSKPILLCLLYIGLNLTKSDIQLSDILRFTREGHISIYNIDHFFPENILQDMKTVPTYVYILGTHRHPTYKILKLTVKQLCRYLNVTHFIQPDFPKLVHRFVQELCLPVEFGKFLERLITFRPPEMPNKPHYTPHYVARAMAYVIFGLKWFFGLDGVSEVLMSESATKVNVLLQKRKIPHESVFCWDEWVKYIEMRSIILTEYHMPTNIAQKGNASSNTQRYADFLNFCKRPAVKKKNATSKQIYQIYEKRSALYDEIPDEKDRHSFLFEPSFTPSKSYIDFLILNHREQLKIPDMMLVDHSKRSMDPFLRPKRFCNQMALANIKVKLRECPQNDQTSMQRIQRAKNIKEMINVEIVENEEDEDFFLKQKPRRYIGPKLPKQTKKPGFISDDYVSDDSLPLLVRKRINFVENCEDLDSEDGSFVPDDDDEDEELSSSELSEFTQKSLNVKVTRKKAAGNKAEEQRVLVESSDSENEEQPVRKKRLISGQTGRDSHSHPIVETVDLISESIVPSSVPSIDILPETTMDPGDDILTKPRRNLENFTMFDDMSDADDEDTLNLCPNGESVDFLTPNFNYWHHFLPIDVDSFFEQLNHEEFMEFFATLPPSFMWLLKQCAIIAEVPADVLYMELLIIEKQFTFVLKPVDQMTTMLEKRKEDKNHPARWFKCYW